jgi:TIR domain
MLVATGRGITRSRQTQVPEVLRSVESGVQGPQDADVTVMAPPKARSREKIIVQVLLHTPDNESIARSKALLVEPRGQELASRPLTIQLNMHDAIKVTLDCEETKIVERVQETYWNGRYVPVQFQMQVPNTKSELVLTPKVHIYVNSILAADTIFQIVVSPDAPELALSKVDQQGQSYRKRFLSHAKEDRAEVLKVRRAVKNLAGGDNFIDVLSMEPGEQWEPRLEKEIKQCDLFVLFWSRHARASEWVMREAELAWKCSKKDPSNPQPKMQPYPRRAGPLNHRLLRF